MNEIKDKDYPGVNTPNREYGWGGIRTTPRYHIDNIVFSVGSNIILTQLF